MCLGIPMRIRTGDAVSAEAEGRGDTRRISMMLVGAQPPGSWVLVHIDTAMRTLDPDEASLINRALDGLAASLRGEPFEHLFADLIDREPELPEHLRPTPESPS
ncbi:MAG: HypC/HybG/HupF family hydrogenase formation chaperone [Azospirillaceae bacterium]|nr:HypC/HybG/HupF family hydrogenase formation chaperone [Azospirillaceae bacterium]